MFIKWNTQCISVYEDNQFPGILFYKRSGYQRKIKVIKTFNVMYKNVFGFSETASLSLILPMKAKVIQSCLILCNLMDYSPCNSPFQNTGVGSLPTQYWTGFFPTQGLNSGLLHCRQILYQLSHKGNPRILEWVAYPFSSRSSRPRNLTGVSCTAGRFFTNWAIRKALYSQVIT